MASPRVPRTSACQPLLASVRYGHTLVYVYDQAALGIVLDKLRPLDQRVVVGDDTVEKSKADRARELDVQACAQRATALISKHTGTCHRGLNAAIGYVRRALPGQLVKRARALHDASTWLRHASDTVHKQFLDDLSKHLETIGRVKAETQVKDTSYLVEAPYRPETTGTKRQNDCPNAGKSSTHLPKTSAIQAEAKPLQQHVGASDSVDDIKAETQDKEDIPPNLQHLQCVAAPDKHRPPRGGGVTVAEIAVLREKLAKSMDIAFQHHEAFEKSKSEAVDLQVQLNEAEDELLKAQKSVT